MKCLLTSLILLCFSLTTFAQSLASLKGKVTDDKNNPSEKATVMLMKAADNKLAKTAVSDGSGDFIMAGLKPGKYYLNITSVGYGPVKTESFDIAEGETVTAPAIKLKASTTELTEVSLTTRKPMIEVRADKTIFNVEGSINATGSNGMELLQKSPGVVIDKDDNISMMGKNGVKIYIDGRPSQMSAKDLADFLRSMNSADMESIELITNPSAKYEAAGNAGIINFRLKKNKKYGANGSITTGLNVGKTPKSNNSFSINFRDQKVNLFSNYSNFFGQNRNNFNLYRKQNDTIYDQHTINTNRRAVHNFKAGMDYFLDAKNTIGFMVNGNFTSATSMSDGSTIISPVSTGIPKRILFATNRVPATRNNMNYNVNYRFANTTGTELNIDGDMGRFRGRAQSYQPNYYRTPTLNALLEEKIYRNNTPTDINIETFKVDYTQTLGKGNLGFGGKYSNVLTKNTFDFYNVNSGYNLLDSGRSNKFDYKENINALYVNYNRPLGKKYSIQAGVRMENTTSEGNLISFHVQSDDNVKRSYTDLFPSAALTYTINPKNTLNLSYSRRIDRPSYQDLNPFENKLDELTYQKGNAFLRPQYTNNFVLTHLYNSRYSTALSYSHIKDYRAQIIDTADKNRSFITQKNLASQDIVNLSISAPIQIRKWWSLFINVNGNYSLYKADFGKGKVININTTAYNISGQNAFSLKDGLTIEMSGFYNSPNIWGGTFKNKALGGMDLGVGKPIFKGKGNVKFSYTDVFKSIKWQGTSDFGGAYITASGYGESNQFRCNVTYRFGNNQVKAARQRKAGLDDESKRLNGSGGLGGQ